MSKLGLNFLDKKKLEIRKRSVFFALHINVLKRQQIVHKQRKKFTSLLCWALSLLIFQMRWQIADAVLLVSNVEESVQNFNVCSFLVSPVCHCTNKHLPFISDCSRVVLSYVRVWTCLSYFILSRDDKITVLFQHEASNYRLRTPPFLP